MSNFQANLHAKALYSHSLKDLCVELNAAVNKSAKGEKFITVFLALVNTKTHLINYVNAGHNPPVLYHNNELKLLEKGTTGLGMFEELPFLEDEVVYFPKGASLFCYTDGLVEQENEQGDIFGLDKLMELLIKHNDVFTMKDQHFRLIEELQKFKGRSDSLDDVTLLSCRSV